MQVTKPRPHRGYAHIEGGLVLIEVDGGSHLRGDRAEVEVNTLGGQQSQ